jgi:hypothetical protein
MKFCLGAKNDFGMALGAEFAKNFSTLDWR